MNYKDRIETIVHFDESWVMLIHELFIYLLQHSTLVVQKTSTQQPNITLAFTPSHCWGWLRCYTRLCSGYGSAPKEIAEDVASNLAEPLTKEHQVIPYCAPPSVAIPELAGIFLSS